jgi:ribosomal protein S18 acetylase RimI-like enzyme
MNETRRTIKTPRGDFIFRPERPDDERFRFELFAAHNGLMLRQAGLSAAMIDNLLESQFRSQTATYRTTYPDAIYSIISFEGGDIGRFVEQDETDVVYFVDFLLAPKHQAKGFGPAITRALMEEWARRGRGTRVEVMINNAPCLKMCRRLGFTEGQPDERAYVELRWYPPHLGIPCPGAGGQQTPR